MDDRFKNEINSSEKSGNINYSANQKSLGDFSENISSAGNIPGGMPMNSAAQSKKFQVHLPDFVDDIPDFSASKPEPEFKTVSGSEYIRSKAYEPVSTAKPDFSAQSTPIRKSSPAENSAPVAPKTAVPAEKKAEVSGDTKYVQTPASVTRQRGVSVSPQPTKPQAKSAAARRPDGKRPAVKKSAATANNSAAKRPAAKKAKGKKKPTNFISSLLVACICLVFIGIFTVTASTVALDTINDILAIDKDKTNTVTVYIPAEATDYNDVFDILKESGFIKQSFMTDFFLKYRHYDEKTLKDDNDTPDDTSDDTTYTVRVQYEPGVYYFDEDMGIETIFDSIKVSSSSSRDSVTLTFPEGWSVAKIFAKLEKYGVCDAEKLYANLDLVAEQYSFMKDIEGSSGRYLLSEGYLFPDTYDFYVNENASSVLKKLFNNFDVKWTEEYSARLDELGMTVDEIITIASIIQREASGTSQMKVISSVIHNRLKDPATYPTLDLNSSKDYIISIQNDYEIFSDFYYNLYLNSYNTYSNTGLPPGPICNPGIAAIEAALYPDNTSYKFFCHDDEGAIYLASTVSEHQINAAKILGN